MERIFLTLAVAEGALLVGCIAAYIIIKSSRQLGRFRFRLIFGVWPEGPKPIVQELINRELAKRALPFLEACAQEEEAIRSYRPKKMSTSSLIKTTRQIQPFTRKVRKAKRKFRDPQNLAEHFGYPALPRATAYLTGELRTKWFDRGKGAW